MSLTQQVIALLRVATEPQSTGQLREQLEAMGVVNAGDVNKRIFALCDRGVVSRVGSGRDTRYQLVQGETLDQMEARSNARAAAVTHLGRAKGRKDGAPTFRDHLLKLIEGTPGITCAAITAALTAAGVPIRRYYLPIDMPEVPDLAKAIALKDRLGMVAAKQAQVTPPPIAPPAPQAKRVSDDPIDRLADVIEQHLELTSPWITATLIAEDIDEDPTDVVKALRRLVDAKRASVRTVGTVREYAFGIEWAGSDQAATTIETGPLSDIHGPISPTPCGPTQSATEVTGEASIPRTEGSAVTAGKDRHESDTVVAVGDPFAFSKDLKPSPFASPTEPPRAFGLLGLSRCIALDIEDAIGRACDQHVEHHAIKALATAAACMRRALEHLHTAGTAPTSTGVTAP